MNETINGLHSCKPGNEPTVGQVKTFVVENKTSKAGKPWLKIKSAGAEFGGTPHRIVSAEKTDFVDPHGNLSFNLEIEPASGATPSQGFAPATDPQRLKYQPNDDRSARIERQHSQSAAIDYYRMRAVIPADWDEFRSVVDAFERDIDQSVKLRKETGPIAPPVDNDGDPIPW